MRDTVRVRKNRVQIVASYARTDTHAVAARRILLQLVEDSPFAVMQGVPLVHFVLVVDYAASARQRVQVCRLLRPEYHICSIKALQWLWQTSLFFLLDFWLDGRSRN